ncbi:MAG: hypothetical protein JSU86_02485, partial [Phycisphaerales bacterium]
AVAVDPMGGKAYWAQTFGDRIMRADLNGDNTETLLEWPVLDNPVAIAVDPASLSDIPTVSEWGIIVMGSVLMIAGSIVVTRRIRKQIRQEG